MHAFFMTVKIVNSREPLASSFTARLAAKEVPHVLEHMFSIHRPLVLRTRQKFAVRTCDLMGICLSPCKSAQNTECAVYEVQSDCCTEDWTRPVTAEEANPTALRRIMLLGEKTSGVDCARPRLDGEL